MSCVSSGGWYVFVHRAMGNYPGFVVGWSDWLSTCATLAVISMVVGEYTAVLFPVFIALAMRLRNRALFVAVCLGSLPFLLLFFAQFARWRQVL